MVDFVISGASGFIGRSLSERLKQSHGSVFEMTASAGDVSDASTWLKLPAGRVLIHLAGKSYVPDSWSNQADFLRANVIGTQNAIDYCIKHKMKMVYISAYLYGMPEYFPIPENHPVKPNNPYASSKHMAEQLCEFAYKYNNLSVAILRLFNVYGPGQRSSFLIPSIFEQIASGGHITVNDLEPRRDYVYIDDVIEAIILAAQNMPSFTTLNIGSGYSTSVREVVELIQRVCGTNLPVIARALVRDQEISNVVADVVLAEKLIGWRPRTSLNEGLRKIFALNGQNK
ncbi:NAD(P)-dependent oxidoreductase [Polynucleobacter sp. MWH-UH2A]|uniref:NAD-dependent epimerase/dehydratase family protein n=1 Tax=Polynucleobacter sp. MWH-UH2A TaxID=1855617 RepID=UPI001BFECD2D|nr:NAD(P)-dependent oxidoreductase [Polynucleobacter sp. MWH-UH2A]QWD64384.1 NAD(P)-dependent oxidoreductase [Polynucleobacter sp. MWH-UH2A]